MSLPVITMLQFLDEPAQLQKFFDLRGKLVTCFTVKDLTLGQRIEQFERTRERIAASENAVIRFLHLEDVEITAFRAILRSRFYKHPRTDKDTFDKLVAALPGGRLEPALKAHIERAEHNMPAPDGNLIPDEAIEAEFCKQEDDDDEPTLPAYHFGQPFAATREPGWDLPVFKGLDPVPVGHVRVPDPAQIERDNRFGQFVCSRCGRTADEARMNGCTQGPCPMIEQDNRFGQPQPWGSPRPDPILDPQDDPRIPHANTMADPNRSGRGLLVGVMVVALVVVAVAGYLVEFGG